MFRVGITFVFTIKVLVSNLIGNSYKSHAVEIRYQKAAVNIVIPDDVMNEFLSAHRMSRKNTAALTMIILIKKLHGLQKIRQNVFSATTVEWITVKRLRAQSKQMNSF